MSGRLVNVDREPPMPLPVDMRQGVTGDDLVYFVVKRLPDLTPSRHES